MSVNEQAKARLWNLCQCRVDGLFCTPRSALQRAATNFGVRSHVYTGKQYRAMAGMMALLRRECRKQKLGLDRSN